MENLLGILLSPVGLVIGVIVVAVTSFVKEFVPEDKRKATVPLVAVFVGGVAGYFTNNLIAGIIIGGASAGVLKEVKGLLKSVGK